MGEVPFPIWIAVVLSIAVAAYYFFGWLGVLIFAVSVLRGIWVPWIWKLWRWLAAQEGK